MNDQSVDLVSDQVCDSGQCSSLLRPTLQHGFGFHMDIQKMLGGAMENLIYGPTKNQYGAGANG